MKRSLGVFRIAAFLAVCFSPAFAAETGKSPAHAQIPYGATLVDTVRDMLWMADVRAGDVVYDLGSGDGRIVISAVRDFEASRAVGIEIDAQLIRESRRDAGEAGVGDRVEFVQGDLFATDFEEASVVTLFLGHEPNLDLRPKLFGLLKPGSRVVSHRFGMGEWAPDKSLAIRTAYAGMPGFAAPSSFANDPRVPDFRGNESERGNGDVVLMWVVPAPAAGVWRGTLETEEGRRDVTLTLHQRLSAVTGTLRVAGKTELGGSVRAELRGNRLRFECTLEGVDGGELRVDFEGRIVDDALRGALAVLERGTRRESEWWARRDEVDLAGTWEWPRHAGRGMAGLRIERRGGALTAAYLDGGRSIPVDDFYDHRGGFYFTLPINHRESAGLGIGGNDDTGWLLGEGVVEGGLLEGTLELYPVGGGGASRPAIRTWVPTRGKQ